ncbi:MAG: serine protease [Alphaproteobacteria bacterium]
MKKVTLTILMITASLHSAEAKTVKVFMTSGTGFFVSQGGHIVTNKHVVNNCHNIVVSGAVAEQPAKIIGRDYDQDLALLKIDTTPPYVAFFRPESQPVEKGERVVIVGYPGESAKAGNTITREAEVLSLKGPKGEDQWMEVSDVIAQGNSGGPLLDVSGNVVGVVTAKATIYTYESDRPHDGVTRNSGIAITLPTLRNFLDGYRVYYREEDSSNDLSASSITDMANRFVVNVRCAYKTEVR